MMGNAQREDRLLGDENGSAGREGAGGRGPILTLKGVSVERAGVPVLSIPSLSIARGETVSLIGPNGAGKTTLLKALCCLIRPREGEIMFRGRRIGTEYPLARYRRQVTMVFQEPLLFDTTVFGNVAAGLRFRGMKGPEIEAVVTENLKLFGIDHLSHRSARKVSGGEAQRVSLARAFAVKPEILALDESFSSLDPPTREALVRDLESVLKRSGATAVLATHDRMEALQLSRRIAVMDKGRIIQLASPVEVMNHPVDPFVAAFVGVETILSGIVEAAGEDGTFTAAVGERRIVATGNVSRGDQVFLCIRPENVAVSPGSGPSPTSARNTFPGRIEKVIAMGPYQRAVLDCGFPLTAFVTNISVESLALREGLSVFASFKATSVHVVRKA
jgi:tungstate transport system ATP-binding protein